MSTTPPASENESVPSSCSSGHSWKYPSGHLWHSLQILSSFKLAQPCVVYFCSSMYIFFKPSEVGKVKLGEASGVTLVQLVANCLRFTPIPASIDSPPFWSWPCRHPPTPPGQHRDFPAGPPLTRAPLTQLPKGASEHSSGQKPSLAPSAPGGHTLWGRRLGVQVPWTVDELRPTRPPVQPCSLGLCSRPSLPSQDLVSTRVLCWGWTPGLECFCLSHRPIQLQPTHHRLPERPAQQAHNPHSP